MSLVCYVLGSTADAAMDKIQFHYDTSIFSTWKNQEFWNPSLGWDNKWKNGDPKQGEAFFGSSTFLVALTDGWHTLQWFQLWFYSAATTVWFPTYLNLWSPVCFLISLCLLRVAMGFYWTYLFDKRFVLKNKSSTN